MVIIKQTDSGHMFIVEQTGVYALIYQVLHLINN